MPFIAYNGRRCLYLHVPKTGGGSIDAWLRSLAPLRFHTIGKPVSLHCTPQHLRMSDFRDLFGEGYFDHVFMSVRNPYDRIVSEYRMHAAIAGKSFWREGPTFSHWLETVLDETRRYPYALDNHIRPQWEFYGSGVEILHFESGLPAMIGRIAEAIGAPAVETVPHAHSGAAPEVAVAFDRIDRLRIQEFYRKDFEVFGYAMDDVGKTVDA